MCTFLCLHSFSSWCSQATLGKMETIFTSAMNAGKSAVLLQSDLATVSRAQTLLFTPRADDRYGEERLRLGMVCKPAYAFEERLIFLSTFTISIWNKDCILIDEARFSHQSKCYNFLVVDGWRFLFYAMVWEQIFEQRQLSSQYLLAWADELELKNNVPSGKKPLWISAWSRRK